MIGMGKQEITNPAKEPNAMDNKYIILYGNPVDGISFEGPFDEFEDAEAHTLSHDNDWWIAELINPDHDVTSQELDWASKPEHS
jgi:hypothetical protein